MAMMLCSVEDCPRLEGLPFSAFNKVVEACTAGDVAMATAMLDSLKLDAPPTDAAASKPSQDAPSAAAAPVKVHQASLCRTPSWV